MANEVKRGKRRVEIGVVTRDKMDKTRRVEIPAPGQASALMQDIRRRTICYVHDEQNQSRIGDTGGDHGNQADFQVQELRLLKVVTKGPICRP